VATATGRAHDGRGEPVPEARTRRGWVASPSCETPGVDLRSDDGEERREGEKRPGRREDDHHRSRVSEGPEEVEGEDEQRRERRGDRERRERHRLASGLHRAHHRLVAGPSRSELFAEAVDDEEAVVDREAEPERGREVDREDRDVGDDGDQEQREERADHGDERDGHRQRSGEQPTEDEHEEHEGGRHGDRFGARQVGLDLVGEGGGDGLSPSHPDLDGASGADVLLGDSGCRARDGLVGSGQVDQNQRRGSGGVPQWCGLTEGPVRDRGAHRVLGGHGVREVGAGGDDDGVVDVAVDCID
jgi:hypothetical protein